MEDQGKIDVKTYIQIASDIINNNPDFYSEDQQGAILSFAKYLDKGNGLSYELAILAYKKAMEIDREVLLLCRDTFGAEIMNGIAKKVVERHRHGKKLKADDGLSEKK